MQLVPSHSDDRIECVSVRNPRQVGVSDFYCVCSCELFIRSAVIRIESEVDQKRTSVSFFAYAVYCIFAILEWNNVVEGRVEVLVRCQVREIVLHSLVILSVIMTTRID